MDEFLKALEALSEEYGFCVQGWGDDGVRISPVADGTKVHYTAVDAVTSGTIANTCGPFLQTEIV